MLGLRLLPGHYCTLLAGCIGSLLVASSGFSQSSECREEQLLNEMCSRSLTEAALRYAKARRAIETDQQIVAWWLMQEMECQAQWALSNGSAQTDPWSACKLIADNYRAMVIQRGSVDDDSRWPWIQWQLGRCLLLESQYCLALTLANPANSKLREKALKLVREVDELTDELQRDIQRRQPLAARQTIDDASQAPAEQLRNLSADTHLLRCEAMIVRSQLYEEGATDRSASLAEAGVLARAVLDRTGDDWPMRSSLLLADATARIETGDDSGLAILQQLVLDSGVTARVRMLAGITLGRTYARREKLSLARDIIDGLEPLISEAPEMAASWKFTNIELAFWQLKELSALQQEDALKDLAEQTRELGNQYGDYWRTRAEGLLVARLSSRKVNDAQLARDLLQAEVRQLTASGQMELACEKLILARDAESLAGNGDYAVELSSMAATLFRHLRQWEDAAQVAEEIACQFHQSANAEEAHLWSIRARAEVIRSGAGQALAGEHYRKSLEDHLRYWPRSSSAKQVAGWLRDLLLTQAGRSRLLESLLSILAEIKQASDSRNLLEMLLTECLFIDQPDDLSNLLEEVYPRQKFASQEVFDACEAMVCTAWALIDGGALANYRERHVLEERQRVFEDWLSRHSQELEQLNVVVSTALAMDCLRLGRQVSGQSEVDLSRLPPEIRIAMGPSIIALFDTDTNRESQRVLALPGLQAAWSTSVLENDRVEVARLLKEQPVSEVALARISLVLGDEKQQARLQELGQKHSKDGVIQLLLAYNFLDRRDADSARRLASKVAVFSQPGSALHWSARWCLIRCDLLIGHYEEAKKASLLVISTNPRMSLIWADRFEQLAQTALSSTDSSPKKTDRD